VTKKADAEELRHLLLTQLALSKRLTAQCLGIGQTAMDGAVRRGAVPTINLGKGSRRNTVPTSWTRQQLGMEERKKPARRARAFPFEGVSERE
jgi:hypothetical protein